MGMFKGVNISTTPGFGGPLFSSDVFILFKIWIQVDKSV